MTRLPASMLTVGAHALFVESGQSDRGSVRSVPGLATPVPTGVTGPMPVTTTRSPIRL